MKDTKIKENDTKAMTEIIKFFNAALFDKSNKSLVQALKNEAMIQYYKGHISDSEHCTVEAWLDHYFYEI